MFTRLPCCHWESCCSRNLLLSRVSTVNDCSRDIAKNGAGFGCGGCAKALARSASALQLVATAMRLDIYPECLQSPQVLYQVSKILISRFRQPSSHSARNSGPKTEIMISCNTRAISPDMVIFPCEFQAGSYCTGAIPRDTCAATSFH